MIHHKHLPITQDKKLPGCLLGPPEIVIGENTAPIQKVLNLELIQLTLNQDTRI